MKTNIQLGWRYEGEATYFEGKITVRLYTIFCLGHNQNGSSLSFDNDEAASAKVDEMADEVNDVRLAFGFSLTDDEVCAILREKFIAKLQAA